MVLGFSSKFRRVVPTYELYSKLLKGGYIGDCIGECCRLLRGILGVQTSSHLPVSSCKPDV